MTQVQKEIKGILYISIKSISNISNKPIKESSLNIHLQNKHAFHDRQRQYLNQIGQIDGKYTSLTDQVNWISLCHKNDVVQLNFQYNTTKLAFLTFPLQKLIEMPRVKHTIECKLIQKQKNEIIKPIKQIVQIQLQILFLNNLLGRLIINGIEANLTRDTQMLGKMDPYVQIIYMNQKYNTKVKEDQGTKCHWDQKIEIPIKFDHLQGMRMNFSIFDKDNFTSDLIGSKLFHLAEQNLLLPTQQVTKKSFMIYYEGQQAGNVTIKYQFIVSPFNF